MVGRPGPEAAQSGSHARPCGLDDPRRRKGAGCRTPLPRPAREALFINIYNALVVHGTAERGAPADTPRARAAFFGETLAYAIGGSVMSADDIVRWGC